jgi:hypothetical protein
LKKLVLTIGNGLPVKTRIAIWFISLIAFISFAFALYAGALGEFRWGDSGLLGFLFFLLVYIGPYILAAYLLTLRIKRAYIAALSILILYLFFVNWQSPVISEIHYCSIIRNILILVPLILIVLDAKSYWKIAK